jgi:hypothetical protein
VCCSSPERFLNVSRSGVVESRPIKGTRPRGTSPQDDDTVVQELSGSVKDRAENLMVVDLVRSDLARCVCFVWICGFVWICVCVYVCVDLCVCLCMSASKYVYMWTYARMFLCMSVC